MSAALKQKPQFDPKRQAIIDKLGDLSHVRLAQNEFLMAIYIREKKTPGGIVLTDKTVKEDVYQGKVGLVVKISEHCRFERQNPETGATFGIPVSLYDWVIVRPSTTWALDLSGDPRALHREDFVTCRLAYDDEVRMIVDNPDVVW